MDPGAEPLLDGFADRPVLAVDEVPELAGVGRGEVRLCDLVRLEQELARDVGVTGGARQQDKDRGVITGEAFEQGGGQEGALVAHPPGFMPCWGRAAAR